MTSLYEIRANYNKDSIVVYQAYSPVIADLAVAKQRFAPPFSFDRMTWIKPSFLWLMHRSHWGQRSNQQRILAVHIKRASWEKALSMGVLTHPEPMIFPDASQWESKFLVAKIHVQWDPERNLRGLAQNQYSIQVGISRQMIREYNDEWIVRIEDLSPTVAKIRDLLKKGQWKQAARLLPRERKYPVSHDIRRLILLN